MPHFKAFGMMNLQYEIRICHKIHDKDTMSKCQSVISKSVFRYRKVPIYSTNIDNVSFYGKFIDIDIDAQY